MRDVPRVNVIHEEIRVAGHAPAKGEGGGVLMNQSPHTLDLICHLAGQPSRAVAWNRTLFHDIETEDTSLALLEWANGALGTVTAIHNFGAGDLIEIKPADGGEPLLVPFTDAAVSEIDIVAGRIVVVPLTSTE